MLKSELEAALVEAKTRTRVSQRVEDIIITDLYSLECDFCKENYNIQYRVVIEETVFYFCESCIDDFTKVIKALGFTYNPYSKNKRFVPIE